ncbi:MAG: ORF6N domain-containing protein [Bacilli bacterium]|nr:ORF6N domain-containing protein [Bacilli bacterium]
MNEIIEKENINIEDMIYEIDGKEVMLDSDLAKLYSVETKRINEAVKNNPDKFPDRFSWLLSIEETTKISRSKISTLNIKQGSNIKYGARVFTEQGIYMLATILKSKVATEVSIRIMDTFVRMRHYINYNKNVLPRRFLLLEDKVDENTKRIDELFDKFNPKEITKDSIFFKGDIYDAYSVLLEIFNLSKDEILIIDNYVGKEILDDLKTINKKIIIISSNINDSLKNKYLKQYSNVTFYNNNSYHDRFIIVDRERVFHSGASFKDLGKKCFAINEIENKKEIEKILENVLDIMI